MVTTKVMKLKLKEKKGKRIDSWFKWIMKCKTL